MPPGRTIKSEIQRGRIFIVDNSIMGKASIENVVILLFDLHTEMDGLGHEMFSNFGHGLGHRFWQIPKPLTRARTRMSAHLCLHIPPMKIESLVLTMW